jgi:hypothetical protein
MFFHMAFWLRDEKAGTAWFGLAVAVSSIAVFAANSFGPLLRKRFTERALLDGSLVVVSVTGLITGYLGGITAGIVLIAVVNGTAAIGRLAFEAIVQSKAPDANRARAFVRFETNNQVAWVVAGLTAVVLTLEGQTGFLVVGAASGLASAYYLYRS